MRYSRLPILFAISASLAFAACGDDADPNLCADNGITTTIEGNHPNGAHVFEVPAADATAAVQVVYDIQGNNTGHGHSVTVSAADFVSLNAGNEVTLTSSDTGAVGMDHTHVVTLDCNP